MITYFVKEDDHGFAVLVSQDGGATSYIAITFPTRKQAINWIAVRKQLDRHSPDRKEET